jgi:hypothetical protein
MATSPLLERVAGNGHLNLPLSSLTRRRVASSLLQTGRGMASSPPLKEISPLPLGKDEGYLSHP